MEEKAKILKVVIQIVGFSVLGCSVIATFLASSSKKKEIPNQIHNGKKASKNITCAGKEVTVTPSKKITCAGKEPSKNITCAGKEPSKNIACAGKEPSKNITCAGKEVTVTPSKNNINQAVEIYFSMEIVMDILSRLPVRYLMRFKCVSKSWKTLISEPYFKAKHWKHGKNNQKILISSVCPKVGRLFHSSSLSSVQSVGDVQKLGCPSKPCRYSIQCCCNGLSLLWSHDGLLLWNPSTNESVVLPNPKFPPICSTYGMGYDSTSDDYKILLIDNVGNGNGPESYPNILALKSGSWRKIDKHPRGFRNYVNDKDALAFLHGAFHWISMGILSSNLLSKYFISSLTISNEEYGDIPLPEGLCNLFNLSYVMRDLSVLGGLLCAHCTCRDNTEVGTFKLWVMKDYGVKESWIELFTIRETHFYLVTPRYRFPDGEVLLYDEANSYFWFWTSKGSFRLLLAPSPFYQGFIYTESLISPKLLTYRE